MPDLSDLVTFWSKHINGGSGAHHADARTYFFILHIAKLSVITSISIMFSFLKLTGNIYRPQQSCGKVIFLHLSVILSTGGSVIPPRPRADTSPGRHLPGQTPPHSECWYTVNKRAVRIWLECNLVTTVSWWFLWNDRSTKASWICITCRYFRISSNLRNIQILFKFRLHNPPRPTNQILK